MPGIYIKILTYVWIFFAPKRLKITVSKQKRPLVRFFLLKYGMHVILQKVNPFTP
jgi:hypothetical protein